MSYKVLVITNPEEAAAIFAQIDNGLNQTSSGDPNGQNAASRAGIFCTNLTNGALYISTQGDDTVEGTTWTQVIFSINPATEVDLGVVRFATAEEVTEGANNDKAITPFSLGTSIAKVVDLQTEINTRSSADAALTSSINSVSAVVTDATPAATPNKIAKRDNSGRLKVTDASNSDEAATKGQMDTADAVLQTQISPLTSDLANATQAATPNLIARRGPGGKIEAASGTAGSEVVNFTQLDATNTTVSGHTATIGTNSSDIATLQSNTNADIAAGSKLPGYATASTLTLGNGGTTVVPTQGWHNVDTYASASAQNCDTFTTTNSVKLLMVQAKDATHIVTLKHGTGNIFNKDNQDIVFSTTDQMVLYALVGSNYRELARFGFVDLQYALKTSSFTSLYNTFNDCDSSSGNVVVTIPTAVGHKGEAIDVFKKVSANSVSLTFTGGQTANGSSSWTLTAQYTGYHLVSDGTNWLLELKAQSQSAGSSYLVNQFRLSASSTDPDPRTDITGATSIYMLPFTGNQISLYDGSSWNTRTASSMTLSIPASQYFRVYNVYVYDNSGTPTIELDAWDTTQNTKTISGATAANPCVLTTSAAHGLSVGDKIGIRAGSASGTGWINTAMGLDQKEFRVSVVGSTTTLTLEACDTTGLTFSTYTGATLYKIPQTQATAPVRQNGIWCKTGTLTRRWVGVIQTNGAGTVDYAPSTSNARVMLSNVDNRVKLTVNTDEPLATWTISSSTGVPRSNSLAYGVTRAKIVSALPQTLQLILKENPAPYNILMALSFNHCMPHTLLTPRATPNIAWATVVNMTSLYPRTYDLPAGSYFVQHMVGVSNPGSAVVGYNGTFQAGGSIACQTGFELTMEF